MPPARSTRAGAGSTASARPATEERWAGDTAEVVHAHLNDTEKTRIEMTGNDVVHRHADHPAAMITAGVPRVGVIIGTITEARLGDPHAEAITDQIMEEQLNQT